jgi:hypothetical protein
MSSDTTWPVLRPGAPVTWLLEEQNPAVRWATLIGLLGRAPDDAEVVAARQRILHMPAVQRILDAQWPEGYWVHPGVGYSPKYKATVWQIIFLAQVGVPHCPAMERAAEYVLDNSRLGGGNVPGTDTPEARFTAHQGEDGAFLCLNGNLLRALTWFGYAEDARLRDTRKALAAQIERDQFRCRLNARTASGRRPKRARDGLPCAWGTIKALAGLLASPAEERSPGEQRAIDTGVHGLLSHDVAQADYPTAGAVSHLWFRLGFPLGYASDLVELLEVLVPAGAGSDPRLGPAVDRVLSMRDDEGCWTLGWAPPNCWASFGTVGRPSKWATLRALRMLKNLGRWTA